MKKKIKKEKKNVRNKNPLHSLFSGGDHLRSISGIICGSGSFAVQFGDHFRAGDHLQSGIICGAVQKNRRLGRKANARLVTLVTVFKGGHIFQILAPFFNFCIELLPLDYFRSFSIFLFDVLVQKFPT